MAVEVTTNEPHRQHMSICRRCGENIRKEVDYIILIEVGFDDSGGDVWILI